MYLNHNVMHALSSKFLLLGLIIPLFAQAQYGDWKKKKDKDGVKVYVREVENYSLKEFKGETFIEAPLSAIVFLINDTENLPEWMYSCKEAGRVKEFNSLSGINYNVTETPWPLSDREIVVRYNISQDPNSLAVKIDLKAVPDEMPANSDNVRIEEMSGFWELTPKDNGVHVVYQVISEAGGNVPDKLANAFIVRMPHETLTSMKRALKSAERKNAKHPDIIDP